MDSFFSRFRNSLVLVAVLLAQTIALAVQVPHTVALKNASANGESSAVISRRGNVLRYWIVAAVTPFEKLFHGTSYRVRTVFASYIALRHTREQNQQLTQEIARLREEQAAFAEDAREGRRVEALLEFRQHYISSTVAAQVVGTSGSDRSHVLYLDKGYADGLRVDQAVITPDGVVGKLREVYPHAAQLLLLSDPTAGAGVVLVSSRIRAIVHGSPQGRVQITNLTSDSRIQPGEHILTSGGDQVFPRGLPVGVIESIKPDPDHQPYSLITLKAAADLQRLEEVLVVTGVQAALPAQAQADAAVAEATAADNKRAAELASERLPSANEAQEGAASGDTPVGVTAGGMPGVPNSGVPKPGAVVHPDRYTPGATPKAEELKPGEKQ